MKAKTIKRTCGLCLAAVMALSAIGCGQINSTKNTGDSERVSENTSTEVSETVTEEPKEPVTLEWYYIGNGVQADTQKVEDRVNELLKEYEGLEHVTIHMNPGSGNGYAQQILLAQTSGKQMDIIHTFGLDYYGEVNNGTFLALDDYLNTEEFSGLKNELPEWLWDTLKVDNATYIVPGYQMGATDWYFVVPNEYQQYADEEKLSAINLEGAASITELCTEIENITVAVSEAMGLTKYCYPVANLIADTYNFVCRDDIDKGSGICVLAGETEVSNFFLDDSFKEACRFSAEWVQKGLLPADAAVQESSAWNDSYLLSDKAYAVSAIHNYGSIDRVTQKTSENLGFDVSVYRLHDHNYMVKGWAAGGNGVTASCENPEEALKFIEVLNTEKGKEIYNTIVYGLEGEHYEKVNENRIKTLEYDGGQGGSDTSYAAMKWVIGNTKYAYLNQSSEDDELEVLASINDAPDNEASLIMGFNADLESVSTEVAQCQAVVKEYRTALIWGSEGADWEAYYNEFVAKMEAAGVQTIIDEVQSQLDAFLAQ